MNEASHKITVAPRAHRAMHLTPDPHSRYQMRHPRICQFLGASTDYNNMFICLEFLSGLVLLGLGLGLRVSGLVLFGFLVLWSIAC